MACQKETPEPSASKIVYNGGSANLTFCFAKEYWRMQPNQGYNFDLFLFSPGLSVNDTLDTLTGTGSHFFAELYCESEVLEGTFTYDANQTMAENTFTATELYFDYNFDTSTGTKTEIKQGTLNVSWSGAEINILLNGTTKQNLPVEITYTGKCIVK